MLYVILRTFVFIKSIFLALHQTSNFISKQPKCTVKSLHEYYINLSCHKIKRNCKYINQKDLRLITWINKYKLPALTYLKTFVKDTYGLIWQDVIARLYYQFFIPHVTCNYIKLKCSIHARLWRMMRNKKYYNSLTFMRWWWNCSTTSFFTNYTLIYIKCN